MRRRRTSCLSWLAVRMHCAHRRFAGTIHARIIIMRRLLTCCSCDCAAKAEELGAAAMCCTCRGNHAIALPRRPCCSIQEAETHAM